MLYQFETSTRALKCVNRKKYNKIIIISNVGPDLRGKAFVDEARKIIGNDVIVLFLAYKFNILIGLKITKMLFNPMNQNFMKNIQIISMMEKK